jgi:hypothetical protein
MALTIAMFTQHDLMHGIWSKSFDEQTAHAPTKGACFEELQLELDTIHFLFSQIYEGES